MKEMYGIRVDNLHRCTVRRGGNCKALPREQKINGHIRIGDAAALFGSTNLCTSSRHNWFNQKNRERVKICKCHERSKESTYRTSASRGSWVWEAWAVPQYVLCLRMLAYKPFVVSAIPHQSSIRHTTILISSVRACVRVCVLPIGSQPQPSWRNQN